MTRGLYDETTGAQNVVVVGMTTGGGPTTTATSTSVSPATDSPPFPTRQQDTSFPTPAGNSISAAGTITTIDTTGYASVSVQVKSIASGLASFMVSNDPAGPFSYVYGRQENVGASAPDYNYIPAANCTMVFPVTARYFRVAQETWTSGTTSILVALRSSPYSVRQVNIGGGSVAVTGALGISTAAATGGLSATSRIASAAASTNATVAKASAGRVYKIVGFNASASIKYLKFYNIATTPVPGTTAIVFTRPLPPGGFSFDWADIGYYFSTGIAYAITGGPLDADNTALAAADIVALNVDYA